MAKASTHIGEMFRMYRASLGMGQVQMSKYVGLSKRAYTTLEKEGTMPRDRKRFWTWLFSERNVNCPRSDAND